MFLSVVQHMLVCFIQPRFAAATVCQLTRLIRAKKKSQLSSHPFHLGISVSITPRFSKIDCQLHQNAELL